MEKRIELEKRGKTPEQIKELTLDNCRSTSFVGLTDAFTNLKSLSAINVGLTSLKGFPKLPKLQKLELSDNRISGGLNILASNCPNLVSLKLSGNKIETVETLEPLKELKNLKTLDLFNCSVSTTTNYREKVFSMFPSLKFLDGYDKDEKEAECSDEENDEKHLDGNSDLDEEEEEEEEDDDDLDGELDDEEEEEDGEIDLKYLEKENIDEESEGEDYSPEEVVDEEEEDEEEDAGEDGNPRGQKRKLDDSQD